MSDIVFLLSQYRWELRENVQEVIEDNSASILVALENLCQELLHSSMLIAIKSADDATAKPTEQDLIELCDDINRFYHLLPVNKRYLNPAYTKPLQQLVQRLLELHNYQALDIVIAKILNQLPRKNTNAFKSMHMVKIDIFSALVGGGKPGQRCLSKVCDNNNIQLGVNFKNNLLYAMEKHNLLMAKQLIDFNRQLTPTYLRKMCNSVYVVAATRDCYKFTDLLNSLQVIDHKSLLSSFNLYHNRYYSCLDELSSADTVRMHKLRIVASMQRDFTGKAAVAADVASGVHKLKTSMRESLSFQISNCCGRLRRHLLAEAKDSMTDAEATCTKIAALVSNLDASDLYSGKSECFAALAEVIQTALYRCNYMVVAMIQRLVLDNLPDLPAALAQPVWMKINVLPCFSNLLSSDARGVLAALCKHQAVDCSWRMDENCSFAIKIGNRGLLSALVKFYASLGTTVKRRYNLAVIEAFIAELAGCDNLAESVLCKNLRVNFQVAGDRLVEAQQLSFRQLVRLPSKGDWRLAVIRNFHSTAVQNAKLARRCMQHGYIFKYSNLRDYMNYVATHGCGPLVTLAVDVCGADDLTYEKRDIYLEQLINTRSHAALKILVNKGAGHAQLNAKAWLTALTVHKEKKSAATREICQLLLQRTQLDHVSNCKGVGYALAGYNEYSLIQALLDNNTPSTAIALLNRVRILHHLISRLDCKHINTVDESYRLYFRNAISWLLCDAKGMLNYAFCCIDDPAIDIKDVARGVGRILRHLQQDYDQELDKVICNTSRQYYGKLVPDGVCGVIFLFSRWSALKLDNAGEKPELVECNSVRRLNSV